MNNNSQSSIYLAGIQSIKNSVIDNVVGIATALSEKTIECDKLNRRIESLEKSIKENDAAIQFKSLMSAVDEAIIQLKNPRTPSEEKALSILQKAMATIVILNG